MSCFKSRCVDSNPCSTPPYARTQHLWIHFVMLWVCKLLQLNHLRLQTLVRLVAKPTYQPHQTTFNPPTYPLRHGWIYDKSPFGIYPVYPLEKNINWLLYFWIKIVDLMLVSFRFGLQEPPPPPFNTSAFYQHVGISPGILGPHGHLTSNTWFCSQLQQGMAKGTMTCILLGENAKNNKLSSPIGHWGVLGSGLGCIIDICW